MREKLYGTQVVEERATNGGGDSGETEIFTANDTLV